MESWIRSLIHEMGVPMALVFVVFTLVAGVISGGVLALFGWQFVIHATHILTTVGNMLFR